MDLPSRRQVLRLGVTGIAMLGSGMISMGTATPAAAAQALWRWCERCSGLWFAGNASRGRCPAGASYDGGHYSTGSANYVLKFASEGGSGQSLWKCCAKCQGLWYGGTSSFGSCSGNGGRHSSITDNPPYTFSSDYLLEDVSHRDRPGGQNQWRWCFKCLGLFFDGISPGASGICPKDHAHHGLMGSADYVLRQL